MWELNNGSYYNFEGDELFASIIKHRPDDGVHPDVYGCQIHPSDGGIVVIGYIPNDVFDHVRAQAICDAALSENMPFAWWVENAAQWWANEVSH